MMDTPQVPPESQLLSQDDGIAMLALRGAILYNTGVTLVEMTETDTEFMQV